MCPYLWIFLFRYYRSISCIQIYFIPEYLFLFPKNSKMRVFTARNSKVKYSRVSIVQASNLKERLEELELKIYRFTIASVDAINMHPSIKLSTIKKSVRFFTRKLTINICLELIRFRMSSTLISFDV